MNINDAQSLAVRYKNIWRGGPATEELTRVFTSFESYTIAAEMLTTAAGELEHPPTIHALHDRYYSRRRSERIGIPKPEYTGEPVALGDITDRDRLDPVAAAKSAGEYGSRRRHPSARLTTADEGDEIEDPVIRSYDVAPDLEQHELEP